MGKHPRQLTHVDDHGVVRFVRNEIIDWLCKTGRLDLNDIAIRAARGQFSVDDQRQLAQLLGYSVSGYHDLSYAEDED